MIQCPFSSLACYPTLCYPSIVILYTESRNDRLVKQCLLDKFRNPDIEIYSAVLLQQCYPSSQVQRPIRGFSKPGPARPSGPATIPVKITSVGQLLQTLQELLLCCDWCYSESYDENLVKVHTQCVFSRYKILVFFIYNLCYYCCYNKRWSLLLPIIISSLYPVNR